MTTSKTSSKTPNSQRKHVTYSYSLPAELQNSLDRYAAHTMQSKSKVVQEALKAYFKEHFPAGC